MKNFNSVNPGCIALVHAHTWPRSILKFILCASSTLAFFFASGQVFTDDKLKMLVKKGADHVYNANPDSAAIYIEKLRERIPDHPVIPTMKAMSLLWYHIPIISEEVFLEMQNELYYAIELVEQQDPKLKNPEMIFFAMAAHGLLAEYFADQGNKMRAISEASRAYALMKKGFDMVDEQPEFLFATGLYNYFREKYPEKHPVYKPFLWFFRTGDIELGLKQLEQACEVSVLTRVEAYVYLSYIYLRYEYRPEKAQKYLSTVCKLYPNNYYAKAKYLESLVHPVDFRNAPLQMIHELQKHQNLYYRLAGNVFRGYYEEKIKLNSNRAESAYRKGLRYGDELEDHGEYFKGLGYLGLGRILLLNSEDEEAEKMLKLAVNYAETYQIRKEAKELLSRL